MNERLKILQQIDSLPHFFWQLLAGEIVAGYGVSELMKFVRNDDIGFSEIKIVYPIRAALFRSRHKKLLKIYDEACDKCSSDANLIEETIIRKFLLFYKGCNFDYGLYEDYIARDVQYE